MANELEAGLAGARQGVTLGFSDEAEGALGAAAQKLADLFSDKNDTPEQRKSAYNIALRTIRGLGLGPIEVLNQIQNYSAPNKEMPSSPGEAYNTERDTARQYNAKLQAESPVSYGAAQVAGNVVSPVPFGSTLKGAGLLGKMAMGAGKGTMLGGIQGLGLSEGNLTKQTADTKAGMQLGGVLGAGLGAAGHAIDKLGSKFAPKLLAPEQVVPGKTEYFPTNKEKLSDIQDMLWKYSPAPTDTPSRIWRLAEQARLGYHESSPEFSELTNIAAAAKKAARINNTYKGLELIPEELRPLPGPPTKLPAVYEQNINAPLSQEGVAGIKSTLDNPAMITAPQSLTAEEKNRRAYESLRKRYAK